MHSVNPRDHKQQSYQLNDECNTKRNHQHVLNEVKFSRLTLSLLFSGKEFLPRRIDRQSHFPAYNGIRSLTRQTVLLLGHVAEQIVNDVSTLSSLFLSLLFAAAACGVIGMSEFQTRNQTISMKGTLLLKQYYI